MEEGPSSLVYVEQLITMDLIRLDASLHSSTKSLNVKMFSHFFIFLPMAPCTESAFIKVWPFCRYLITTSSGPQGALTHCTSTVYRVQFLFCPEQLSAQNKIRDVASRIIHFMKLLATLPASRHAVPSCQRMT